MLNGTVDDDVGFGLSMTDVADILSSPPSMDLLDANIDMLPPDSTPDQQYNTVASTCDNLPRDILLPISDQFVQLPCQGHTQQITNHATDDNDKVCNPATVNSISACTNTVTGTSTILNQVQQLTLVDAQDYNKASTNDNVTIQQLTVQGLQNLHGTSDPREGKLIQMLTPIQVLTGTTNTEQVYVLSMGFDENTSGNEEKEQEHIRQQVAQNIIRLEKEDTNLDVSVDINQLLFYLMVDI